MKMNFKGRNLLTLQDYTEAEIRHILKTAHEFKKKRTNGIIYEDILKGKKLCMIFQKPSTRTIISFDAAMYELGGHSIVLNSSDMQLGRGESIRDTGKTIARYCDAIMARVYNHDDLVELAMGAGNIPIINGLSDLFHPCQILADLMTIEEHKKTLENIKIAYIGDGNNVAHSLLIACSKLGINISVACPDKYKPKEIILMIAQNQANNHNAVIEVLQSPQEAVKGADVIYTDTWVSMGQDFEKLERESIFRPYQINENLLRSTKNDCIVMHCLPAHRGFEITDDVIDGPHSVIFDQAENRLHVQKAVLFLLLG